MQIGPLVPPLYYFLRLSVGAAGTTVPYAVLGAGTFQWAFVLHSFKPHRFATRILSILEAGLHNKGSSINESTTINKRQPLH